MKEIKFRGKSLITKEWIVGSLVKVGNENYIVCFDEMELDGHHIRYTSDRPVFTNQNTIGQFTGLYDRNQNPIYEGDIVRSCEYKNIKHIVFYDNIVAAFVAVYIDENTGTDLETKCHITQEWIDNYLKEVAGNIYDNKELLNQE